MWEAGRRCLALLEPSERRRWYVLVPLALLAAGLEAIGAAAIFLLIRLIGAPGTVEESGLFRWAYAAFGRGDRSTFLVALTVGVGGFYVLKNVVLLLQTYASNRAAQLAVTSLSSRLLAAYLGAPYRYFFGRSSAELIRNIQISVSYAYSAMLVALVQSASEAIVLLALVLVLILTAPGVTLLAAAGAVIVLALLLRRTYRTIAGWGIRTHRLHGALQRQLHESLSGIKEIKAFGRERRFVDRYTALRAELSRIAWRQGTLNAVPRLLIETCFVLAVVAVILAFEAYEQSHEIVPVLGLFTYAGFRMLPALHRIVGQLNLVRFSSRAIFEIYEDFTGLDPKLPNEPEQRLPFRHVLEVDRVSFTYDGADERALTELSFEVRRGESVGIVGATGAGKSTLIDLLLGLLEPTEGAIRVDGAALPNHARAWRRSVGYVPQTITLMDDTIARNIALGLPDEDIDAGRIAAAISMAQLDELIARLPEGLRTLVGERGVRLSGGERQRVAIARALYREPDVLLFDEATSALDNLTERELTRAIEMLQGKKTVIVVAHRLSTVRGCRRILFLERGRIIDSGAFDELVARNVRFSNLATGSTL